MIYSIEVFHIYFKVEISVCKICAYSIHVISSKDENYVKIEDRRRPVSSETPLHSLIWTRTFPIHNNGDKNRNSQQTLGDQGRLRARRDTNRCEVVAGDAETILNSNNLAEFKGSKREI